MLNVLIMADTAGYIEHTDKNFPLNAHQMNAWGEDIESDG